MVAKAEAALSTLSKRERQILTLYAADYSPAEIVEELMISQHTLRAHVRRIRHKLDVVHLAAAVAAALRSEEII